MAMLESIKFSFVNFYKFSGRTRRSEFWFFVLAWFIVDIGLVLGLTFLSKLIEKPVFAGDTLFSTFGMIGFFAFSIYLYLALLSSMVRRLHDSNISGSFVFIGIIPFIGFVVLIYLLCRNSVNEDNQYDP